MGSFDDILKKAISNAAKKPEPDPAKVSAEQAKKDKEKYDTNVRIMVAHATGLSFDRIKKEMGAAGVSCGMAGDALVYENHDAANPRRSASIKCKIESDFGVTVSASKDQYNKGALVEIAKFSPADVKEMVSRMGEAQSVKHEDPDSDHPLTRAIRDALTYLAST